MTLLSTTQQAAIKSIRLQAWTREFQIKAYVVTQPTDDFYADDIPDAPTSTTVKGDWVWREQLEMQGRAGGLLVGADVLLGCDEAHLALLTPAGVRIVVESVECAILAISRYADTGELVVQARKVT